MANLSGVLKAIEAKKNPEKPVSAHIQESSQHVTQVLSKAIEGVDVQGPLTALEERLIKALVELGVHLNTQTDGVQEAVRASSAEIISSLPKEADLSGVESNIDALKGEFQAIQALVGAIDIPEPKDTDLTPVVQRLEALEQRVNAIEIPEPFSFSKLEVVRDRDGFAQSLRAV